MKYKVIFSKNAKGDLESLSQGLVKKQSNQILEAIKKLDIMPMRFPLFEHDEWQIPGIRFMVVNNYLVFYMPDEKKKIVNIYRIIHGKRNVKNLLKENITFK